MVKEWVRAGAALAALLAAASGAAPASAGVVLIPPDAIDGSQITFPSGPAAVPDRVYSPKLLAASRTGGSLASVNWSGSFTDHRLLFDLPVISGNNTVILGHSSGTSFDMMLRSGRYAFYCSFHGGINGAGMSGVVYVAGPRAKIEAKPEDAAPGGQLLLDASTSDLVSRSATATATYEFDPEGDGTYLPPSTSPTMMATYPTVGTFDPRVRVTDEAGRSDLANDIVYIAAPDPPAQPPGPQPPTGGDPPAQSKPPASTPTGAIPFSRVATLPDRRKCISRKRGLRIVVRDAPGENLRRVRVRVDGRLVKDVAVKGRRALTLRGLRGRPSVTVSLKLLDGRTRSKTFRYRVCGK